MKKVSIFFVIILLSLAVNVSAKTKLSKAYQDRVQKNFLFALTAKNDEIRNSAIFVVVKAKAELPELDLTLCLKQIQKMSKEDDVHLNRVHAQLAMACFERLDLLQSVNPKNHLVGDTFFNELFGFLVYEHCTMK